MEKVIESVGLTLHGVDGQRKEIPLEVWQVEIICQILGLTVKVPDLDDYEMSPKDRVAERMELYNAMKELVSQNREKEEFRQ